MIKDFQPSDIEELEEWWVEYPNPKIKSASWAFPCDESGNIFDKSNVNYQKILSGEIQTGKPFIRHREWTSPIPAEGTCDCGERLVLEDFTNECPKCGLLWNGFGQALRPECEWEEYDDDDPETPDY